MQALETGQPGAPVGWRSEQSAAIMARSFPGPTISRTARRCRAYTHTVYINGRPEVARGTACRNPDGTWMAVS